MSDARSPIQGDIFTLYIGRMKEGGSPPLLTLKRYPTGMRGSPDVEHVNSLQDIESLEDFGRVVASMLAPHSPNLHAWLAARE